MRRAYLRSLSSRGHSHRPRPRLREPELTYEPDASKQQCELVINNSSDAPIMYKMKSTRPGLYKMRPVYGLVNPSSEATVKLIYKGLKPHDKVPMTDRFSVICAPCPSTTGCVGKMWKAHKYHKKMAENELKRKKIHILYRGVNDNIPLADDDGEESAAHKSVVKKGPGLVDNEVPMGNTQMADPKREPILLMYRKTPDPETSFSDEENEDENNGNASEMSNHSKSTHSIAGNAVTAPLNKQVTPAKPVKVDSLVPADVAIKAQGTLSNAGGPQKGTSPGTPGVSVNQRSLATKGLNPLDDNGKPKSMSVAAHYGGAGYSASYSNGGGAGPRSVAVASGAQGPKSVFAGGTPQENQMSRPFEPAETKKTSQEKENN